MRGVRAYVESCLSGFAVEGDGLDLSMKDDRTLVLRGKSGLSGLNLAWLPIIRGNAVVITPGMVYAQSGSAGFIPYIGSSSLAAETPPTLPLLTGVPNVICLVVEVAKTGEAKNLPWKLERHGAPPASTLLIRPYNGQAGQDGKYYFPICEITGGAVVAQYWLSRPIAVTWTYNNVIAW